MLTFSNTLSALKLLGNIINHQESSTHVLSLVKITENNFVINTIHKSTTQ